MAYRNYGPANGWVVSKDGNGNFKTITLALNAATSGQYSSTNYSGDIFIAPGTYTENLTLVAGVNLVAWSTDQSGGTVTISGTCTFTGTGYVTISGINLQTNGSNILAVTGSSASNLSVNNCYLNCTNATGMLFTSSSANANINITNCQGDLGTTGIRYFNHSSAGTLTIDKCSFTNSGSSLTASTCSAGFLVVLRTDFYNGITTSGTSSTYATSVRWNFSSLNTTAFTCGGSGQNYSAYSLFATGSAVAISLSSNLFLHYPIIATTNSIAISGTGTLRYCSITYSNTGNDLDPNLNIVVHPLAVSLLYLGSSVFLTEGAGSPSGSVTAPKGSLYLNTTGSSSSNRAYINTNGGTSWTAILTAS
jgi:hypothetical protein